MADDLYLVPDHARYILKTEHHNAIHASFRVTSDVDVWVSQMAARGFTLPEDLPDETFKRPHWMDGEPE